jgi:hypothetical protein
LGEDEELRGKLEAAVKRQDLAECALLSREEGFDFDRADLKYLANLGKAHQNGQLSEEQLELVTGGSFIDDIAHWIGNTVDEICDSLADAGRK